jgi:hypothetical protein
MSGPLPAQFWANRLRPKSTSLYKFKPKRQPIQLKFQPENLLRDLKPIAESPYVFTGKNVPAGMFVVTLPKSPAGSVHASGLELLNIWPQRKLPAGVIGPGLKKYDFDVLYGTKLYDAHYNGFDTLQIGGSWRPVVGCLSFFAFGLFWLIPEVLSTYSFNHPAVWDVEIEFDTTEPVMRNTDPITDKVVMWHL